MLLERRVVLLDAQLSTRVAAAQLGHSTTAMTFRARTSIAPDSSAVFDQLAAPTA